MRLTNKQKAFVIEYVKDFNANQAAIRAGYSEKTARQMGYENLTKPYIIKAIDKHFSKRIMSANEVLYHLTEIARSDIGEFVSGFNEPDMELAKSAGKSNLVKRIKTKTIYSKDETETHQVEFELYDRLKALELMGRYHQLTTTTRVKTWRDDAIEAIKNGDIAYDAFVETFQDESLAQELFRLAGVPISD